MEVEQPSTNIITLILIGMAISYGDFQLLVFSETRMIWMAGDKFFNSFTHVFV